MRSARTARSIVALCLGALACTTTTTPSEEPTLPEIRVENVVCPEGSGATTSCAIPVRLSAAGTANALFRLTLDTASSTAADGADFTYAPSELSIPAGETGLDVNLTIVGDLAYEPDEVVAFRLEILSGATPAAINGTGALVTIANDDAAPPTTTIRVENRLCPEGNRGTSTCSVPVRLSEPAPSPVTFSVYVDPAGSTATFLTDHQFNLVSFTIPAGETSTEIPVVIVGDFDFEPDEVIALKLENVTGAIPAEINGTGALVTITNDDPSAPPATPAALGAPRFQHTATKLADGRVFIAGGHDGAYAVSTTLLVSDDGRNVTAGPALPEARARHSATLLADGRVLLAGGLPDGSPLALSTTVLCDLAANACTRGPDMLSPRMLHAAIELADHRVLIAGGVPNYGTIDKLSRAELFTTGPDRFVATENELPAPCDSMAAARLPNGEILLAGGAGVGTGTQLVRYRPGTGFLLDASSLGSTRVGATASVIFGGRVLIVGGFNQASSEVVSASDDPARALNVSPGASMSTARHAHAATTLADGRVVISGGYRWDAATSTLTALSSVEVFDGTTGDVTPAASLSAARGEHAAVALDSGYVVHVGGSDGAAVSATMDVLRP